MDEMVNKVAQRTGIAADTVRTVLTAAADFIKQKLPHQFATHVDTFLKGGGPNPPTTLAGLLGGR